MKIARNMYADPVKHEFPLDTASNTYKSAAYALADKGLDHPLMERIKEAAVYHDIEEDIISLIAGYNEGKKEASTETSVYALVCSMDGSKQASSMLGLYPLNNYNEILESARCLVKDKANIPPVQFKQACLAVVEQARVHNVPTSLLHQTISENGEQRLLSVKNASYIIEKRCARHPEHADIYRQVLQTAVAEPMHAKEAAAIVLDLDDTIGYVPDSHEVDPIMAFCSGYSFDEVKKAGEGNVVFRDVLIPLEDLRKVDGVKLASYVDEKVASDVAFVCRNGSSADITDMLASFPSASARDILSAIGECTT